MGSSFVASTVISAPIDGIPTVAFSEQPDSSGMYLLLQRSPQETEQDRRLGLVGTYVEFGDHSRSGYGCIESFTLQRNAARLMLDAKACAQFEQQEISVIFSLTIQEFEYLRSAVSVIIDPQILHVA